MRNQDIAWPKPADSEKLKSACAQSHSAMQWLARMANSFCMPAHDASHLHLSWVGEGCTLRTLEVAPGTVVEMRLPALELQFVENGEATKHVVELDDKSPAEIEAWTLIELLHRGIDRDRYTKDLPYDVSGLLSGDARHYETLGLEAGFSELASWFAIAAEILKDAGSHAVGTPGVEVTDLQISPQDFSLFLRVHPGNARPSIGRFAELGFCADVDNASGLHFYVDSTPQTSRDELPALGGLGQWQCNEGSRAILPASELRKNAAKQQDLEAFFALTARLDNLPD